MFSLIGRNLLAAVGAVVSVAGLMAVLFNPTAEHWVKLHAILVYYLLLAVILVSFVTINYLVIKKGKVPSEHDREAVGQVFVRLPPDGPIVHWLRYEGIDNIFPFEFSDVLAKVHRGINNNIVGLDNQEVGKAYRELGAALGEFLNVVGVNTQPSRTGTGVSLGGIIDWKRKEEARRLIDAAQDALLGAYDQFWFVSHKKKLDQLGPAVAVS